jgi:outer membrane protein assembly factor BamB
MRTLGLAVALLTLVAEAAGAVGGPQMLLYATEGNRLRRFDLDTVGRRVLLEDVLVDQAGTGFESRDVNGMICAFPDGSGRFVIGEDTGQPDTTAGWGVFDRAGRQIGKLTASYTSAQPEPYGCAFAANGTLFTVEVGDQGFGAANGQLIQWFPPFDEYPGPLGAYPDTADRSTRFCKLATNIGTAGGVAIDAQGRVYVASSSNLQILRFAPPFPTAPNAAGGCGRTDSTGAPLATVVNRTVFATPSTGQRMFTFSGLAIAPNGNLYAASVLTGRIAEYDLSGALLRFLVDHEAGLFDLPKPFGTPQGIAVGPDGTVYYADLDLQGALPSPGIGPGGDGKVWRVRFDENGDPLPPEVVRAGLAFPDGVAVVPGNLQSTEWPTYGGNPERQFFNHDEYRITPDNVASLVERWRFPTNAIITASPTVADVKIRGEGLVKVAFIQSWDGYVYAIRMSDGSELWRFLTDEQPGASYPQAASVHFDEIYGRQQVYIASGEVMYALDARTGRERWRFTAGTGCGTRPVGKTPHPPAWFHHPFFFGFFDDHPWEQDLWQPWGSSHHHGKPPKPPQPPGPPGLCSHQGERNQIESSAIAAGGKVFFGMDVDDSPLGRGGFYAVSAWDGSLAWFFDPESGKTCRPHPFDRIHYFDGYHSAQELGLPAHFFRTRPGCNFDRRPTGCGNIWSSPAYDASRKAVYIATSNCDTDDDPTTGEPPPPMPPYDEALFALDLRGKPLWRWRPREIDNGDLAFGAAPNLFSIEDADGSYEVVGIGNKDGTYYVIGRDGVNERTGVRWDDPDPSDLPYWRRNVVAGGVLGGLPATSSVDEVRRRVIFSTAPGGIANTPPGVPQTPVFHALDLDTGDIVWETNGAGAPDASFAPTSSIPGVSFFGSVLPGRLRAHRTDDDSGTQLLRMTIPGIALASAPVAIDGTLIVGGGIGVRTGDPTDIQEIVSRLPVPLTAWCVPGTDGCPVPVCGDGRDNDGDGRTDFPSDAGCVFEGDQSEVKGDLDFDGDIDGGDAVRMSASVGSVTGDDSFIDAADFDRDGDVDAVDETAWYAAYAAAPRSALGERDDPASARGRRF